jgi:hypothetical protein
MRAESAEERLLRKRTIAEQDNLMRAMRRAASHSGGSRYQGDGDGPVVPSAPPAEAEPEGRFFDSGLDHLCHYLCPLHVLDHTEPENESACVICISAKPEAICLPCGHLCLW